MCLLLMLDLSIVFWDLTRVWREGGSLVGSTPTRSQKLILRPWLGDTLRHAGTWQPRARPRLQWSDGKWLSDARCTYVHGQVRTNQWPIDMQRSSSTLASGEKTLHTVSVKSYCVKEVILDEDFGTEHLTQFVEPLHPSLSKFECICPLDRV
jgi:hypothetical protein